MQPLNAYGLVAEQLGSHLAEELPVSSPVFAELSVMGEAVSEIEAGLWLLQEFWRLDSLPATPSLSPTSLDSILEAVLNRLKKRRPRLSVSLLRDEDTDFVQSSGLWLVTLLSCLFESEIQGTRAGLQVDIRNKQHEVEIRIGERMDEGIETLVSGLGGEAETAAEHGRGVLALHVASVLAGRLQCRLSVDATEISLVLPASSASDRQSVTQADRHAAFSGRQIVIFENDAAFAEELAGLFRVWGCDVLCLGSSEQIGAFVQDGKFVDALFVGFALWQHPERVDAALDAYLKHAANLFVTVGREYADQVPADRLSCIFLPRPFSPVRLRKHMMSLFSQAG